MTKLKVGLVGGSRGGGIIRSLSRHPRAEIAAICDIKEKVLEEMGAHYDLPDNRLYAKFDDFVNAPIDIVVVATPIEYHAEQSIAAMENGKHVLSEQTAAYTVADCERLIDTVKKTGKVYMMGENYCYFHYVKEWKKIIEAGRLGKIYYAEGEYIHEIVQLLVDPETGERKWRYPRAPIWYCAHCLGPLLTLMDDRIVEATGATSGKNMYPDEEGLGFLDIEVGLYKTQKGAVIKILRSQVAKRPHVVWYSLYGTKGCIEGSRGGGDHMGQLFIEGEMTQKDGAKPILCSTVDPDAPEEAKKGGHGTSEYFMVRDFMDAIDANSQPPIDVIRSVEFTIPGILAHEAAMKGGIWLDVPQYGW